MMWGGKEGSDPVASGEWFGVNQLRSTVNTVHPG